MFCATCPKDGKKRDIRNQTRKNYRLEMTPREKRKQMIKEGFPFIKSSPKMRYVTFAGSRAMTDALRENLR
jgi:hypothetical protein